MSTKKKVVKKVKVVAEKKVPAPKKEKAPKAVKAPKSTVELVSFGIKATIPVMVFGNIQPEIVVKAKTIEEAKAYALPIIEDLFNQYVEAPRDGSPKPTFVSKANVTVTEKNVPQGKVSDALNAPTKPATAPAPKEEPKGIGKEIEEAPVATEADLPPTQFAKSAALIKAEGAVAAAMSRGALDMIENQVKESTKLTPEEKPMVFTLILKKRKEFE